MWRRRAWIVGVHGPAVRRTVSPTRTTVFMLPPVSGTSGSGSGTTRRHAATIVCEHPAPCPEDEDERDDLAEVLERAGA